MRNYRSEDSARACRHGQGARVRWFAVQKAGPICVFDYGHFCNLDAVARLWSLQVAVSELEIIALSVRVATLPLFLLSLLLSLLLNSFRFLLKPGGGDSIGTVRSLTLDLSVQTGAAFGGRADPNTGIQGSA